jgi:hypothetical protein
MGRQGQIAGEGQDTVFPNFRKVRRVPHIPNGDAVNFGKVGTNVQHGRAYQGIKGIHRLSVQEILPAPPNRRSPVSI